jgi:hypothetical protein
VLKFNFARMSENRNEETHRIKYSLLIRLFVILNLSVDQSTNHRNFVQILYNRIGILAFLVNVAILRINNLRVIKLVSCSDPD